MQNIVQNKIFLQKNDVIEAEIDDNALDGAGVAHYEDYAVFIKGAIKGERVRAKIIFVKSKICFAIIEKILTASVHRVEPPCPYYLKCGGCSMQHIDYFEQLSIKKENLITTLKKQGINASVKDCVPSENIYRYRNKLSLPVRGSVPEIGFFYKNSHRVIAIKDCLLQNFDCKKLIEIISRFLCENNLSGFDEQTLKGDVRHIVARKVSDLITFTIVTAKPLDTPLKALNEILKKEYGNSYALYVNLNTKNNNVIFSDNFKFIGGNTGEIEYSGTHTTMHPAAFFQVNDDIREKVYEYVKNRINDNKTNNDNVIIDAYAGAGFLSLSLLNGSNKVYSVEINAQAHNAAAELKRINGADNLECVLGDCNEAVPKICEKENGKNIIVVLDPPRSGSDGEVLNAVLSSSVSSVIYISCNPATLARDLKILSQKFEIESVCPFDMFPQTDSLETVVILRKR